MTKRCNVIVNNEAVTVVRYGDIDVRFPSVNDPNVKQLSVDYDGSTYHIVDGEKEKSAQPDVQEQPKTVNSKKVAPRKPANAKSAE